MMSVLNIDECEECAQSQKADWTPGWGVFDGKSTSQEVMMLELLLFIIIIT